MGVRSYDKTSCYMEFATTRNPKCNSLDHFIIFYILCLIENDQCCSLTIFVEDNQSGGDVSIVHKIALFGTT